MSDRRKRKPKCQYLTKEGTLAFSQVPISMGYDPDLKATDIHVATLIMPWLKKGVEGWVANKTLAEGARITERGVQMSLGRLKAALWFSCRTDPRGSKRRRITALWRTPEGLAALKGRLRTVFAEHEMDEPVFAQDTNVDSPPGTNVGSPDEYCSMKMEHEEGDSHSSHSVQSLREITLSPMDGGPLPLEGGTLQEEGAAIAGVWLDAQKRIHGCLEALATAPRGSRGHASSVDRFAREIAKTFLDEHSLDGYRKLGWGVVRGEVLPADVREAIDSALAGLSSGRVNNPGSYFRGALANMASDHALDEMSEEFRRGGHAATNTYPALAADGDRMSSMFGD